jgi:hypothetical protein
MNRAIYSPVNYLTIYSNFENGQQLSIQIRFRDASGT